MGSFIAQQPNGLYCRFSSIVDCPTCWNMTKEEFIQYRLNEFKEELETYFEARLKPFEWVEEYFRPINMTEEKFKEILEAMKTPVDLNKGE